MLLFKISQILKYVFFIVSYGIWMECSASISDILINDLRNAFKIIANDSTELNNLLQKMHDLQNSSPFVVFNMSLANGCNKEFKMQRQSFMTPTFPILTKSFMHNMKEKRQSMSTSEAEWSILGLDGWTGKLSKPANENIQRDKLEALEYPEGHILEALNKAQEESSISTTEATPELWQNNNNNVYIARANNPFGFSTKWQQQKDYSNSSHDDNLEEEEEREKRDVANLYSMIKCATGCNPVVYQGHGCFCGFLGTGVPEDSIDHCCQRHDKCYAQSKCINFIEYFVPYVWKCYHGKPVCAIFHGAWGGENSCSGRLCHCDLQLSVCLRQYMCPQMRAVCTSSQGRRLQNFLFVK